MQLKSAGLLQKLIGISGQPRRHSTPGQILWVFQGFSSRTCLALVIAPSMDLDMSLHVGYRLSHMQHNCNSGVKNENQNTDLQHYIVSRLSGECLGCRFEWKVERRVYDTQ